MFSAKKRFSRTDLACEAVKNPNEISGAETSEYKRFGFRVSCTKIKTAAAEKQIGKPRGAYYTIFTPQPHVISDGERMSLVSLIAEITKKCILSQNKLELSSSSILVAGIGNRNLTSDAVGPFTVDSITVTRTLKYSNGELFSRLNCSDVSAIAPGVSAETGIEAADIIGRAAETVEADVIILIDALAARSCSRLASTVQISDVGITPGSGIGNSRTEISAKTMNVPVVTIGVPTVVDSATLIYEAIVESGIDVGKSAPKLNKVLKSGKSFFVSPQDADVTVRTISKIIADAVNLLCGTC